jgi:integrase
MKGLEIRKGRIRIHFTLDGRRWRETLHLDAAKPAQLREAVRLREQIELEIRVGAFDYRKTFPNSPRFAKSPAANCDFESLATAYLASKGRLAPGTREKYRQAANFWVAHFRETNPARLDVSTLKEFVGSYPWPSGKHCNNQLIVLRGILDVAVDRKILLENPALRVENSTLQHPSPNPLKPDEVTRVLKWMREKCPPEVANYFQTAFFSGMRPQEFIALEWKDVDFEMNVISVVRAISAGELSTTKTHRVRLVAINAHTREALLAQQELTGARQQVFLNPATDRPWIREKSQREQYWKPALKACGIRPRHAYQTRHTFASLSLMAGANTMWVAGQMGHTSTKMVLERYAAWIDLPGRNPEYAKIESMFKQTEQPQFDFVPEVSQDAPEETPRC